MPRVFSCPRHRRDYESYKREVDLAGPLDDRARVEMMREMFLLYQAIQKTKSPERIEAEERAERRLNAWRLNPRYRRFLEDAHASENAD